MDTDAARRDELLAAMVGDQMPNTGPIRLAEYEPSWPVLFEREASTIRNIRKVRARSRPGSSVARTPDATHTASPTPTSTSRRGAVISRRRCRRR